MKTSAPRLIRAAPLRGGVDYVRQFCPQVKLDEICRKAGIDLSELSSPYRWVSVDFALMFWKLVVDATGDKDLIRLAGRRSFSGRIDSEVLLKVLMFWVPSVRGLYEIIPRAIGEFNRLLRVEEISVQNGRARVAFAIQQGLVESVREKVDLVKIHAENLHGYLEAVPTLLGAPFAEVKRADPGTPDSFGFEITFQEPPRFPRYSLGALLCAQAFIWVGPLSGTGLQVALSAVGVVAMFGVISAWRRKKRLVSSQGQKQ